MNSNDNEKENLERKPQIVAIQGFSKIDTSQNRASWR